MAHAPGPLSEQLGVELPFLSGGVARKRREEMVDAFQADGGPPLLILSLKAGGVGLNLTAANHVVHYDRWWNPAVEDQATDRAFRIGQQRNVQVRKFVCVGTVEERIDAMIESSGSSDRTWGRAGPPHRLTGPNSESSSPSPKTPWWRRPEPGCHGHARRDEEVGIVPR